MKIKEMHFVLFELIHRDNVVSSFYVFEEALKVLCRSKRYKYLYNNLRAIMAHTKVIEERVFGKYDVRKLYTFRTIDDYLQDRIISFKDIQGVAEECVWISIEMDNVEKEIFGIEADDANGNLIDAWLEKVPDEAYHPVSEW